MTRALTAAIVALLAVAGMGPQQRPTFRARTDLVTVDISVTSDKRAVPGLTLADFELTDNGVRQKIELLDAETLPIDLSIVLDQSSSMKGSFDAVKKDVREIAAMLHPADRIRLFTFAGDIRETVGFQPPDGDLSLHTLAASGSTSLFDAVAAAIIRRRDGERRHLMVVLTDGFDTSSLLGRDALDDLSRRSDATVYAAVSLPAQAMPPRPSGAAGGATRAPPPVGGADDEAGRRDAAENRRREHRRRMGITVVDRARAGRREARARLVPQRLRRALPRQRRRRGRLARAAREGHAARQLRCQGTARYFARVDLPTADRRLVHMRADLVVEAMHLPPH